MCRFLKFPIQFLHNIQSVAHFILYSERLVFVANQVLDKMLLYTLLLSSYFLINSAVNAQRAQVRIVGGSQSAEGQLPWQVIIKRDVDDELLCGGSVIAANWVLTAGHCTVNQTSLYMVFGTIYLFAENAVNMTSSQFFLHPDYDATALNNDLSLILLPKKLQFSDTIQAIALSKSPSSWVDTTAVIAGFGLMDDEILEYSSQLLYGYVNMINPDKCEEIYGSNVVKSYTLCSISSNETHVSICSGDSGGPLITQDDDGNDIQIGINSFVKLDACNQGYPAGYIDVGSFSDYIQKTMKENSK